MASYRMSRLILRFALLFASGAFLNAAIGIELHPTRRSENFIVHDLRDAQNRTAIGGGGNNGQIELGPDVLAVSADRIKHAVADFLGVSHEGGSAVHLILVERSKVREDIRIEPIFYGNAWQYRVELADSMTKENLIRGLVDVVLIELANRGNGPKSAEIPRWLKEGLTFQLLNTVGAELVLSSVEQGSMFRSVRNRRGADPLHAARAILGPGSHPSVSDLSYPLAPQLEEPHFRKYQAAAQLFLLELLRMPAGDECLFRMLRNLPNYWNWEKPFLIGFSPHFESLLDVEKWWAVTLVSFSGRDPTQVWSPSICLQQLDEILLPTIQSRWSIDALPVRGHASLQQILKDWDFRMQNEVLWQTIRRLTALRTYCPPGFELRMTTADDPNRLEAFGRSLVVVGLVNGVLHFRVFDPNGRIVWDTTEAELPPEKAELLARFRQVLERFSAQSTFAPAEKQEIIDQVVQLVGFQRPPEIVPVIDAYRVCLLRYLEKRASLSAAPSNKLYQAPSVQKVVQETVRELDDLYRRREALRRGYTPSPLAGVMD